MRLHHSWNVTPKQAIRIQKKLAPKVVKRKSLKRVRLIAGCDIAYDPKTKRCFAGVIVFRWPGLERIEEVFSVKPVRFPYVPGLLSFREIPALLDAIKKLSLKPDLFLVDGQGIAHPRRIGLASHLGLILNQPTIGAAKSRLIGDFQMPGRRAGNRTNLYVWLSSPRKRGSRVFTKPLDSRFRGNDKQQMKKEIIGAVLRTRTGVRPIFVSIGHKVSLKEAVKWVLRCCRGFRIPEPTRQADIFVEKLKNARKIPS